jgi:hypothetical protein
LREVLFEKSPLQPIEYATGATKGTRGEQHVFGFEPEITVKMAKLGCRIYDVPLSYHGRTYAAGKKIN